MKREEKRNHGERQGQRERDCRCVLFYYEY